MAIPLMEEDVEVISKLGDVPGSDDGLSTQELKKRFDLGAARIKNFINKILIPAIENSVNEGALLGQIGSALSEKLSISGGTMTGPINMNGRRFYNLKAPAEDADAATKKYVDDAKSSTHFIRNGTLLPGSWVGETAPYTQNVNVEGILTGDCPHVTPSYSDNSETALVQEEAWATVSRAKAFDGYITFICSEYKPEVEIPIQIEVNR